MKISEEELKQIVVEALQGEEIDEGIFSALKGAIGKIGGDAARGLKKGAAAAGRYRDDVKKAAVEASVEGDIKALTKRIEKIITKLAATGNKEALTKVDDLLTGMAGQIDDAVSDIDNPEAAADRERAAGVEADLGDDNQRFSDRPAGAASPVAPTDRDIGGSSVMNIRGPDDPAASYTDEEYDELKGDTDDDPEELTEGKRQNLNEGQISRFAKLAGLTKGE